MIARTMLHIAWHVMFFKFQISFKTRCGALKGNTNAKMLNLQISIQSEITFILAHRYAIFLCSLDVEIEVGDSLDGQLIRVE